MEPGTVSGLLGLAHAWGPVWALFAAGAALGAFGAWIALRCWQSRATWAEGILREVLEDRQRSRDSVAATTRAMEGAVALLRRGS